MSTPVLTVGLVSCGRSKLDHPAPARDLYTGRWVQACMGYVERTCDEWAILSALHGLVDPDTVLEPYRLQLGTQPAAFRRVWAATVGEQLEQRWPHPDTVFVTTVGAPYRKALMGRRTVWVFEHLPDRRIGYQLAWLKKQQEQDPTACT